MKAFSTRRSTFAFLCFATLVVCGLANARSAAAAGDKLLLVSWDGVGRSTMERLLKWQHLNESPRMCPSRRGDADLPTVCGNYLTCLPNLCGLTIHESWDSNGKPLTRPQHAQMLSGYRPETSGVTRNNANSSMPPGYTVYERLLNAPGPRVRTVHVAGRKYVSRGVVRYADRVGAIEFFSRRGGPDYATGRHTTDLVDPLLHAVAKDRFFVFVHYKAADVTAHHAGSESASYEEAIVSLDEQLGELLGMLDQEGIADETAVLVTTDHGFKGRFHVAREPIITQTWIASRNIELRSDIVAKILDITPTVLDYFGVPLGSIQPPLEGMSLLPGSTTVTVWGPSTTTTVTSTTLTTTTMPMAPVTTTTLAVTTTLP